MLRVSGINTDDILQVPLVEGVPIRIGRLPDSDCPVVWDRKVSRDHAVLTLDGDRAYVKCEESAANPLRTSLGSFRELVVEGGDRFQIGQTIFELILSNIQCVEEDREPAEDTFETSQQAESDAFDEYTLNSEHLRDVAFHDSSHQMELLCDLPRLIASAHTDIQLAQFLTGLLLEAIPEATAVAAAQWDRAVVTRLLSSDGADFELPKPVTMRVQTRDEYEGRFVPSRRLVTRSLKSGECTIHIWGGKDDTGQFTMCDDLNWAYCVPVPGDEAKGWCLYVAGQGGKEGSNFVTDEDLRGDVRFTQLLAQFIGSIRQVRQLQEHKTRLSSYFSPKVVENLTSNADVLAASEQDISVLFCDVRGFSRKSEKHRDDLQYLLTCVKQALGVMTQGILRYDGAIADFQGDAALGFWGWPVELEDGAVPACLAALAIADEFRHPERHNGLLDDISIGLGVAHGRAIAGQIGTTQQAKIGVFGPVVNQGARLESLTRQLEVSIIVDEATADFVKQHLPAHQARVRKLARVCPKGMDTAITISEILQPVSHVGAISDDHLVQFEAAVELIVQGDWSSAIDSLEALPDDGPKQFLLRQMSRTDYKVPADWDGAFRLNEK